MARFDGTWSVEVVTEQGVCDAAYRYRAVIERGVVRYADGDTFTIKGSIVRGAARAEVIGRLVGRAGSGTWMTSVLSGCRGHWNAERRA